MSTQRRLAPKDRKAEIMEAAIRAAVKHGFAAMRAKDIAEEAGCAFGLLFSYFGTMAQMRRAVMRAAIKQEVLCIIAEGVACRDSAACKAPKELQDRALSSLRG